MSEFAELPHGPLRPLIKAAAAAFFLAAGAVAPCGAAPGTDPAVCIREAESLKQSGDTAAAEKKLALCEAAAPKDPAVKLERADNLVRLGRYEQAAALYRKASGLIRGDAVLAAACRRKLAQVYVKLNSVDEAITQYRKALEFYPADAASAAGLGAIYEARSDLKQAEELYALALKHDPANTPLRDHLDELRFSRLSPAQLMDELHFRGAAYGKKPPASSDDLLMLNTMRLAERNGAVDYLHGRIPNLDGLAVEKLEGDRVRLLLTPAGLKTYQNILSRDAVAFFEKNRVPLNDVFALRDLAGQPVFDKNGRLTLEGMKAYWLGKTGTKSWLLRYEAVVKTPEDEEFNKSVEKLFKEHYIEVTEIEYLWLLRVTECPEDVLRGDECNMKMLHSSRYRRYFLFRQSQFPDCNSALNGYIEDYRAGETDISKTTRGTNFFGSGGNEKHRMCEGGKLWGR